MASPQPEFLDGSTTQNQSLLNDAEWKLYMDFVDQIACTSTGAVSFGGAGGVNRVGGDSEQQSRVPLEQVPAHNLDNFDSNKRFTDYVNLNQNANPTDSKANVAFPATLRAYGISPTSLDRLNLRIPVESAALILPPVSSQVPKKRPYTRRGSAALKESASHLTLNDDEDSLELDNNDGNSRQLSKTGKPLLTEEEKRMNHIESEKKRRQNIKAGLETLVDMVPSLSGTPSSQDSPSGSTTANKSEAVVLGKTVEYLQYLLRVREELKSRIGVLRNAIKEPVDIPRDDEEDEVFQRGLPVPHIKISDRMVPIYGCQIDEDEISASTAVTLENQPTSACTPYPRTQPLFPYQEISESTSTSISKLVLPLQPQTTSFDACELQASHDEPLSNDEEEAFREDVFDNDDDKDEDFTFGSSKKRSRASASKKSKFSVSGRGLKRVKKKG